MEAGFLSKTINFFVLFSIFSLPAHAEEVHNSEAGMLESFIDWATESKSASSAAAADWIEEIWGETVTIFGSSKEEVAAAANFVGDRFIITKDITSKWSADQFDTFLKNHPSIAETLEATTSAIAQSGDYVIEKAEDGGIFITEVTADGAATAVEWTQEKINTLPEVTACDVAEYDFLGGLAIGTLGTSLLAAPSTTAVAVYVVEHATVWSSLGAFGSTMTTGTTAIVSTPAVATGLTVAALSGATVYATAKGLCYFSKNVE